MPAKYTYLLVDFCCVIFPLLFSFYPKILFYKQWKYLLLPLFLTAVFFIVWDVLFTRWEVWGFNPDYVLGFYFLKLPLEEMLFFICIPYACVFTYYSLKTSFDFSPFNKWAYLLSLSLSTVLLLIGALNAGKLYTSVTFVLLSFLLMFLTYSRFKYMAAFFVSFFLILIPFFISNGILTGTGTEKPVVWYNNQYSLGLRMFTIPLEDVFYGMLLLLMNLWLYESFLERKKR